MLQIKQFIVTKPIESLDNASLRPEDYVCFFENNKDRCVEFVKANIDELLNDNLLSFDGGISFKYQYREYLGVEYWDDLPMLWAFIINTLEECLESGEGKCLFPGQPVEIAMKDKGTNIQIQFDHQTVTLDKKLVVKELLSHGKLFYETLVKDLNLSAYKYDLDRVNRLASVL
ncbi:hypothetical protein CHH49_09800 [Terribacillus saccharophilus]|uniref:hypothetical protein n=1 Tax=Terribacillus saccharophilus TaxID=361277 RepID=UPI000BA6FA57|nr:hypothetical protein [Terribacillus saccharophilus]PAF21727.1 hypothetical protein CHH49_09800 [Terribacillus saccharophilus]